uniref:Uncharacterized protein n=1 Tax=Onchocerca volvulus TaxID=6282 RepID=A0A8R1Y162_ONCVO
MLELWENARWSTSSRKKRRNKPPPGYEDWSDEDKQYYQDVSTALRQWKASQVQCQLRRFTIGFWKHLKYQLKGHPMHAEEMKDYKKTLETFVVLKEDQSLDID